MQKFRANPKVFLGKESRKVIRAYNRLAKCLVEFETLYGPCKL